MNKTMVLGFAAIMTLGLVACAGEEEEKTSSSSDELSAGCITGITARPGSPEWRAELNKCLNDGATTPAPTPTPTRPPPGDVPGSGNGGGQSCSTSVQCINGSCTCGSGPNQGASCDGTKGSGAGSCSEVCSVCE